MAAQVSSSAFPSAPFAQLPHLPSHRRFCPGCPRSSPALGRIHASSDGDGSCSRQEGVMDLINGGIRTQKSTWWTPLFELGTQDWSSTLTAESGKAQAGDHGQSVKKDLKRGDSSLQEGNSDSHVDCSSDVGGLGVRGVFTPEKARLLRKALHASETWHESMYHSGVASRLASSKD